MSSTSNPSSDEPTRAPLISPIGPLLVTWVWVPGIFSDERAAYISRAQGVQSPYRIDWNLAPTGLFQPFPTLLRCVAALRSRHNLPKVLLQFSIMLSDHIFLRSNSGDQNVLQHLVSYWRELMKAVPLEARVNLTQFQVEVNRVAVYLEHRPAVINWFKSTLRIRKCDAYVLASITAEGYDSLSTHRYWVNLLLAAQPRYTDLPTDFLPSNFPPSTFDSWNDTTPYLGPILNRLLSQFPNEPYAQRECLHAISNAGNATVRHLLSNDRQLLDSWLDFQDIIVEEFSRDISNPISEAGPVDFRQAFVNINIRGLTDFFAHVVIHAWEHIADNHLGWMMHRSILHCAASKPTWCTAHQRTLRDSFEDAWVELLTSDEPIEDWDPFPEDSSSMIDDDVDDDEDNIPDGLSAVSFEPVGEDYNVHRFAARVHIEEEGLLCLICHFDLTNTADDGPPMKLNVCSHIYHFDCLSQHINGVESWSTTCPSCREKICEPRGKRPKIGEDVEMQGAGNQNTDEAEQ